jgi:outer membrane protein TolC
MKRFLISLLVLAACVLPPAGARAAAPQAGAPQAPGMAGGPVPSSSGMAGGFASGAFAGGVPTGEVQPGTLPLSISAAIDRGLKYNLGLLFTREDARDTRGERWKTLSSLLPNITAGTSETREQLDLAAFGFSGLPGFPTVVGPFNVFDVRAYLSQSIFDLNAIERTHEQTEKVRAADYTYQDARDVVVLVCANLYLETVAESSRVDAEEAQVKTAQALYDRAADLRKAGVVADIDVLRAQVELQARQQRLIYFRNEFAKQKLGLARAIGLPVGQLYRLTDTMPYTAMPPIPLDQALDRAYASRADYAAARARVKAAEAAVKAARGDAYPSVRFDSNYGDIGNAPSRSHGTFAVAATVAVPIFQGGRVHGEVLQADARLKKQQAAMDDLRARIAYEIETALLDMKSSSDRVQVAESARGLANEELQQAQDRFSAGVVSSIEVVQAQDALATADENYISSLYTYNVAKASLARAMGIAEKSYQQFIGGH